MADRAELLAEAYRRGLLPPQQRAAYEEAQRRGLTAGGQSRPPQKRTLSQDVSGFMANVNRGSGIGDEIAAGFKTGANMLAGRASLSDVPGAYKNALAEQRALEDDFMAAHPKLANLARGTGMAPTVLLPAGGGANVFAQGGRAMNAIRGATSAGLSGAAYSAVDAGTPEERLTAASETATNPLVLGAGAVAGRFATPAHAKAAKVRPEVAALRERGVPLTPGQAKGGLAKTAEDAFTSTPILGTAIQEARGAGLDAYNRAWGDEALSSVGERLPDNIPAGHETVAFVQKRLGELYDKTIPGRSIAVDEPFKANIAQRLGDIAQDMTDQGRQRLAQILQQRVSDRVGGAQAVTGEQFQRIMSELSTVKGRFSGSQDADQRAIAEGIEAFQDEMRQAAARQDPQFAEAKTAIDRGYATFKRLQSAAGSVGAEGGVATPAQFGGAVRRADKSVDKGRYAAGEAFGQDMAGAGRAVLPSKTPDSGTAGRGAWAMIASAPAAILTGGAPAAAGYAATLGGLKLASKAYAPEAIAAFNRALDARISSQQQRAAVDELRQLAARDPRVADLYREAVARLTRAPGVIGGQQNALSTSASPAQ